MTDDNTQPTTSLFWSLFIWKIGHTSIHFQINSADIESADIDCDVNDIDVNVPDYTPLIPDQNLLCGPKKKLAKQGSLVNIFYT